MGTSHDDSKQKERHGDSPNRSPNVKVALLIFNDFGKPMAPPQTAGRQWLPQWQVPTIAITCVQVLPPAPEQTLNMARNSDALSS